MSYLRKLLILAIGLMPFQVFSQQIDLAGTVFGYSGDQLKVFQKVQKNVSIEGMLDNVHVTLLSNSRKIAESNTDTAGTFIIGVPATGKYTLQFSKPGYSLVTLDIQYVSNTNDHLFRGFFLMLKQQETEDTIHVGSYVIEDGMISFFPSKKDYDPQKEDNLTNNITISTKAAPAINHLRSRVKPEPVVQHITRYVRLRDTVFVETPDTVDEIIRGQHRLAQIMGTMLRQDIDENNLGEWKRYLDSAKIALSALDTGSLEYQDLVERIQYAEQKIQNSEKIIALKKQELKSANRTILYIGLFSVFLGLFILLLAYFLVQRKKHLKEVKEKNERISRINENIMSSIRYAGLIQNNFLDNPANIRKLFPGAFIYNKPKELVSGDFYWFGKQNGTKIIVAADCTGHGVPGAMLTVLGHSALDNLVYNQGFTAPSDILNGLNKTILNTFEGDEDYMPHGMDISVVAINEDSDEMVFCGAMNGIYTVKDQRITAHAPVMKSLGTEMAGSDLSDQTLKPEPGSLVIMFSDGYYDQFKGNTDRIEKFNLRRFEELLLKLEAGSLDNADKILETEFEQWRGDREQIDDVLIIGFRV